MNFSDEKGFHLSFSSTFLHDTPGTARTLPWPPPPRRRPGSQEPRTTGRRPRPHQRQPRRLRGRRCPRSSSKGESRPSPRSSCPALASSRTYPESFSSAPIGVRITLNASSIADSSWSLAAGLGMQLQVGEAKMLGTYVHGRGQAYYPEDSHENGEGEVVHVQESSTLGRLVSGFESFSSS